MKIAIRHSLSITIGEGVPRAVQHILMTPQSSASQNVIEWTIDVQGLDGSTGFVDAYGNRAHLGSMPKPDEELSITAGGVVETTDRSGIVGRLDRDPVAALFLRQTPLAKPIGAITSRLRSVPKQGQERIAALHALMERVGEVIGGEPSTQSQSQSQSQSQNDQSQQQSQGSAEEQHQAADYAHAFIGSARALGIPARFVTGYLAPDDEDDHSGLHAWAEAWDDGLG